MPNGARVIELPGALSGTLAHPGAPTVPDEPVLLVGSAPWWQPSGLEALLRGAGWGVITAADADRARWLASIQRVSLVVIGGSRAERWHCVRAVRAVTGIPMVVLADATEDGDDADDVVGLVGASVDAVFDAAEPSIATFARLQALFRRADHRWGPGVRYLRSGELVVDLWSQKCTLGAAPIVLSSTEFALLTFLMTRPDVALPINTIVCRVWGLQPSDGRNALRIIVNRLRRKLEDDPRHPTFIASLRGIGYRFVGNVVEVADSVEQHSESMDVTPLFATVAELADALAGASAATAGDLLADAILAAGLVDGLAIFRVDGRTMRLVASRGMPEPWLRSVDGGVPLDHSFASAHSVLANKTVQFADVRAVSGVFGATTRELAEHGFRACQFLPITVDGEVWGHLGLGRRSVQPFDSVAMGYVGALCATFALHVRLTGC